VIERGVCPSKSVWSIERGVCPSKSYGRLTGVFVLVRVFGGLTEVSVLIPMYGLGRWRRPEWEVAYIVMLESRTHPRPSYIFTAWDLVQCKPLN
jgi:hypothetical protein